MISSDLIAKYGLPEDETTLAVEAAISSALSQAFDMDILAHVNEQLEILTTPKNDLDSHSPSQINLSTLSRQLKRQIRHQISRELEKRQCLREWDILRSLRGQTITGEILKVSSQGDLTVALEVEDHFRNLILTGICPARHIPRHEKGSLQVGNQRVFLVSSVLPVLETDKAKVLIRLSRTSKALPESLLRQSTGDPSIRCRRRIAGAFSEIETPTRIPKEAILAVGKELKERIVVRVVESKKED